MRVNTIMKSREYDVNRELKNHPENKTPRKNDKDKYLSFSEILKKAQSSS